MPLRIGIATLLLGLMAGCGSSSPSSPSSPSTPPTSSTPGMVSIVNGATELTTTAFAPNPIDVATGATITWMNNDTRTHDSTSNDGSWASGPIAPGGQFSRTFSSAGTFPYRCTIHPGMVGTVNVR